MYEVANLDNPPFYLPLGKDAVGLIRNKLESLGSIVNDYEGWSEDLLADQ